MLDQFSAADFFSSKFWRASSLLDIFERGEGEREEERGKEKEKERKSERGREKEMHELS